MRRLLVTCAAAVALLSGCGDDAVQGPPSYGFGELAPVRVDVAGERVPIEATVRVLENGSPGALREAGLTTLDLTRKYPVHVRVAYANPDGRAFPADAIDQQFRPRQSDGRYAQRLDIISSTPFEPCEDPVPPASFSLPGGMADACLVVLVDEGTTIEAVEWTFLDRTTAAVWRPPS